MTKTNQTDNAPARPWEVGSESHEAAMQSWRDKQPKLVTIPKSEHAALVAVAELAKSRVENHGCENYTDGKSYCDCNTCKTREALANLAAVREGGGK
jgi:hypothetical protein